MVSSAERTNNKAKRAAKPDKTMPSRVDSDDDVLFVEILGSVNDRLSTLETLIRDVHESVRNERIPKESYTTKECAEIVGRTPGTVREWCRLQRMNAKKALCGRGGEVEWRIPHEELLRYEREGLLPVPDRY